MADTATEMPVVNETVNATAENVTAKIPATPEGMFVAYSSLVIMALIPIFLGSFRSVRYHKEQKVSSQYCHDCCLSLMMSTHMWQFIYLEIKLD
jgi:hypothetical protein